VDLENAHTEMEMMIEEKKNKAVTKVEMERMMTLSQEIEDKMEMSMDRKMEEIKNSIQTTLSQNPNEEFPKSDNVAQGTHENDDVLRES